MYKERGFKCIKSHTTSQSFIKSMYHNSTEKKTLELLKKMTNPLSSQYMLVELNQQLYNVSKWAG